MLARDCIATIGLAGGGTPLDIQSDDKDINIPDGMSGGGASDNPVGGACGGAAGTHGCGTGMFPHPAAQCVAGALEDVALAPCIAVDAVVGGFCTGAELLLCCQGSCCCHGSGTPSSHAG